MSRALASFESALALQPFRAIVFDYDGTLCSSQRKNSPPSAPIVERVMRLLDAGIVVGVASGRGDSIQEHLRDVLPSEAWSKVHLGLYNGGWIGLLDEEIDKGAALRAFWNARAGQDESYQRLLGRQVMHETDGPQLLGVLLSCASGYADLPPGASMAQAGLFRALFDCRVVLRTLRSLASLVAYASTDQLTDVRLEYDDLARDLKSIPTADSAVELVRWAEERERAVYAKLDTLAGDASADLPLHVRFESVLWLQSVKFLRGGKLVAPRRLLMIDDLQKLRKKQRELMLEELVELRPAIPVWLAERSIALGEALLSQGAREGRDLRHYPIEDMWTGKSGQHQFATFAQSILDRRLDVQREIPAGAFSQYLEDQLTPEDLSEVFGKAIALFAAEMERHRENIRYADWLAHADEGQKTVGFESLMQLSATSYRRATPKEPGPRGSWMPSASTAGTRHSRCPPPMRRV